jgi:hypothetical protein
MNKTKGILLITTTLAILGVGYWFYEKQRVKALNEKVDSLEDALAKLNEAKNG